LSICVSCGYICVVLLHLYVHIREGMIDLGILQESNSLSDFNGLDIQENARSYP
jgi:hypothetical protein